MNRWRAQLYIELGYVPKFVNTLCSFFVNFYSFQQVISKAKSVIIDNYKMKSIKDLEKTIAINVGSLSWIFEESWK